MFDLPMIVSCAMAEIENQRARAEFIKTLPQEKQDEIRKEDREIREKDDAHRRAIEIAKAGRARNFWGN